MSIALSLCDKCHGVAHSFKLSKTFPQASNMPPLRITNLEEVRIESCSWKLLEANYAGAPTMYKRCVFLGRSHNQFASTKLSLQICTCLVDTNGSHHKSILHNQEDKSYPR